MNGNCGDVVICIESDDEVHGSTSPVVLPEPNSLRIETTFDACNKSIEGEAFLPKHECRICARTFVEKKDLNLHMKWCESKGSECIQNRTFVPKRKQMKDTDDHHVLSRFGAGDLHARNSLTADTASTKGDRRKNLKLSKKSAPEVMNPTICPRSVLRGSMVADDECTDGCTALIKPHEYAMNEFASGQLCNRSIDGKATFNEKSRQDLHESGLCSQISLQDSMHVAAEFVISLQSEHRAICLRDISQQTTTAPEMGLATFLSTLHQEARPLP